MPAVRFAIASTPQLSERDAFDLAELLTAGEPGRNLVALKLAAKLRSRAELDPAHPTSRTRIALDWNELGQIAAVFVDRPDLLKISAYAHLNKKVRSELEQRNSRH